MVKLPIPMLHHLRKQGIDDAGHRQPQPHTFRISQSVVRVFELPISPARPA